MDGQARRGSARRAPIFRIVRVMCLLALSWAPSHGGSLRASMHQERQLQNGSSPLFIRDITGVIETETYPDPNPPTKTDPSDLALLLKPRVVGGSTVARGKYPYFCRIDKNFYPHCGGTLVAPDVVLSAAHCRTFDVMELTVLVNGYHDNEYINPDQRLRRVVDMQVHPNYTTSTYYNDLMLLKLNEPVSSREIPYVELNRNSDLPGLDENVTVMGLGALFEGGGYPDLLQSVKVDMIDNEFCTAAYEGVGLFPIPEDIMICAGKRTGAPKDACQGDSGGPLLDENEVQVGVISFGLGCARQEFPGVYARTAVRGGNEDWLGDTLCSMTDSNELDDWCATPLTRASAFTTTRPTEAPTSYPTSAPTAMPTSSPTARPSLSPTTAPTVAPTSRPTTSPTAQPTSTPTESPTRRPTVSPTRRPTDSPTGRPSSSPTASPTAAPTGVPTSRPTDLPTVRPSNSPTSSPTAVPTGVPTSRPTDTPTARPSNSPTSSPTALPTGVPTSRPTDLPTARPSSSPTSSPTAAPTGVPTSRPTDSPTARPSNSPTLSPTALPTLMPTQSPTESPTGVPTQLSLLEVKTEKRETQKPTSSPTAMPSYGPTVLPTSYPTNSPTGGPSARPSNRPTGSPTTGSPTRLPTAIPTSEPTGSPTRLPTSSPTVLSTRSSVSGSLRTGQTLVSAENDLAPSPTPGAVSGADGDTESLSQALKSADLPPAPLCEDKPGGTFYYFFSKKSCDWLSGLSEPTIDQYCIGGSDAWRSCQATCSQCNGTGSPTESTDAFGVSELLLIDADTNDVIPDAFDCFPDICIGSAQKLSVVADTDGEVGSVRFIINGPIRHRWVEDNAPYALWSDKSGEFNGYPFPEGKYTLVAQAFSEKDGEGAASKPLIVSFSVPKTVVPETNPGDLYDEDICIDEPRTKFKIGWWTKDCGDIRKYSQSSIDSKCKEGSDTWKICRATCGRCSDECVDHDEVGFKVNGKEHTCSWLRDNPVDQVKVCEKDGEAYGVCRATCGACVQNSATESDEDADVEISEAEEVEGSAINTVVSSPESVPATAAFGVNGFTLVDADSDQDVEGGFNCTPDICLGSSTSFNIRADTFGDVRSVRLSLDGPIKRTELQNVAPWALWSDTNGDYNGSHLPNGTYTVEATAFTQRDGDGEASDLVSHTFTVGEREEQEGNELVSVQGSQQGTSSTVGIEGFTLVDADTDQDIQGGFNCKPDICLGTATSFNIRADAFGDIESVRLSLDGPIEHTEVQKVAPWALWSDSNGDYNGSPLPPGQYSLTAQAFGRNAQASSSISFSVGNNAPSNASDGASSSSSSISSSYSSSSSVSVGSNKSSSSVSSVSVGSNRSSSSVSTGSNVSSISSEIPCIDEPDTTFKDGSKNRDCAYLRESKDDEIAAYCRDGSDASRICRATCGQCSGCADYDEIRFRYKRGRRRNCSDVRADPKLLKDACKEGEKAYGICRKTCGACS